MAIKFGYKLSEDGKTIVPDEIEQDVIRKIIACHEAGMSIDQVRSILDSATKHQSLPSNTEQ